MKMEVADLTNKDVMKPSVSELLESGKSMLKELSNEFEERLLQIHKEQMEKWQERLRNCTCLTQQMRRLMFCC